MNNHGSLFYKLSKDIKKLENGIKRKNIYNIRNYTLRALIKSGIAIDYVLPYILSGLIVANSQSYKENKPFEIDNIMAKASIETVDTSSGFHLENISYNLNYDTKLIEHSTGWIINDLGLYERTITSYRISNDIDLADTQKILSMSKEEIENILVTINIQTICKNSLAPEDKIYDSDALIVTNSAKSENDFIFRPETTSENVWNSILYIVQIILCNLGFKVAEKLFIKNSIKKRLHAYESSLTIINKENLVEMKKILMLKKQNLEMLDETAETLDKDEGYSYKLRKI